MVAAASERVMAKPSKLVESQPYIEHASLPPNVGAKQREMETILDVKIKFAEEIAKKLTEARELHERIMELHAYCNGRCDCLDKLKLLEEAYDQAHARFVKEYRETGEIGKVLYSGAGKILAGSEPAVESRLEEILTKMKGQSPDLLELLRLTLMIAIVNQLKRQLEGLL